MRRQTEIRAALLGFCVLALVVGIWHLISLRLDRGSMYPPYSSLRSDPLGTRALLDSLRRMDGVRAERNYRPWRDAAVDADATWIFLGVSMPTPLAFEDQEYAKVDEFVRTGGRLVITLAPVQEKTLTRPEPTDTVGSGSPGAGQGGPAGPIVLQLNTRSFLERQGLRIDSRALEQGVDGEYLPAPAISADPNSKMEPVPWHSSLHFSEIKDPWNVMLTRDGNPVMIWRQLGKGSLVIATDSYFVSNEALRKDRRTELLIALVGERRHLVFDEVHLGIAETPGVATLARRYRLNSLGLVLLLIVALFIWRNALPLVPPSAAWEAYQLDRAIAGKTAAEGFVYLLRRNIRPKELLAACFREWERSIGRQKRVSLETLSGIERLLQDEQIGKDPTLIIQAYQRICKYLNTRKG